MAIGIAAAYKGVPVYLLVALAVACVLIRLTASRPAASPWFARLRLRPGGWVAVLLPLLFMVAGHVRYGQWQSQPDPLAGMRDRELLLAGESRGGVLTLSEPAGARVAVSPAGALPEGRVELIGTLVEAGGRRNPGGFDYAGYLRRRGVHGQVRVEEIVSSRPRVSLRERLRQGATRGLGPRSAALVEAMTLGIRDELGGLREQFAAAGLAHVLALSGLHVGVLLTALGWLLSALGVWRYPLLIGFAFGFVVVVGASPSIVRATLMATALLGGLWFGAGRLAPWPAFGLAALVTLLARPAWLFDISFQLSYGAVAGILLFALPLASKLPGGMRAGWSNPKTLLTGSLLTSAAAQSLTLPLVASSFGTVPLFSPIVNLVALPVASLLVPLGFAAGLLGLLALPLAGAVNLLAAPLAGLLIWLAQGGAELPAVTWGEIAPAGYLYFTASLTALALWINDRLKLRRALLVCLGSMLLSAGTPPKHALPEFVAIDVGQGDSFLVRLPGRVEVLVDAGGSPFSDFDVGEGVVVPALRALGVDELELVVATHPDVDHIEGLPSVLRHVPVQLLVYGVADTERRAFAELIETAEAQGVEHRAVTRGERIRLGGALLEVLNPPAVPYGVANEDSVGFALAVPGGGSALLLGDISHRVEAEIAPPAVTVLAVPHHGSGDSSSERLLRAAAPRDAVVSVGRNGYGHPHGQVLDRLDRAGARVHITRDSGAVRLPLREWAQPVDE